MPIPSVDSLPLEGRDRVLYVKLDISAPDAPLRSLMADPKGAMGGKLNPNQVSTLLFSYTIAPQLAANERAVYAFEETSVVSVLGPALAPRPAVPTRRAFLKFPDPAAAYLEFLKTWPGLTETLRGLLLGTAGGSDQEIHLVREGTTCFVHVHLTAVTEALLEFHVALMRDPEFLLLLVNNPSRPLVELNAEGKNILTPEEAAKIDFALERTGALSGAYQSIGDDPGAEPSSCVKLAAVLETDPNNEGLVIVVYRMVAMSWPPPVGNN